MLLKKWKVLQKELNILMINKIESYVKENSLNLNQVILDLILEKFKKIN